MIRRFLLGACELAGAAWVAYAVVYIFVHRVLGL